MSTPFLRAGNPGTRRNAFIWEGEEDRRRGVVLVRPVESPL
jgi:hypothetical protein